MKSIFTSKTFWFNVITGLVVVATYFGYAPDPAVADKVSNTLILVSPIANIILRYFTTEPVKLG